MRIEDIFEILKKYDKGVLEAYLEEKGDFEAWVIENGAKVIKDKAKADIRVALDARVESGRLAAIDIAKEEISTIATK